MENKVDDRTVIQNGIMELYNATRLANLPANGHDNLHRLAEGILQRLQQLQIVTE